MRALVLDAGRVWCSSAPPRSITQPALPRLGAGRETRTAGSPGVRSQSDGCVYFTEHLQFRYILSELHGEPGGQTLCGHPQCTVKETEAEAWSNPCPRHGMVNPNPRKGGSREPGPRLPVSESQRGGDHRPWDSLPHFPDSGTQNRASGDPSVHPHPGGHAGFQPRPSPGRSALTVNPGSSAKAQRTLHPSAPTWLPSTAFITTSECDPQPSPGTGAHGEAPGGGSEAWGAAEVRGWTEGVKARGRIWDSEPARPWNGQTDHLYGASPF